MNSSTITRPFRVATRFVFVLNLLLLASVVGLGYVMRDSNRRAERLANALSEKETELAANIQAQQARIAQRDTRISDLQERIRRLESAKEPETAPSAEQQSNDADDIAPVEEASALSRLVLRPDVFEIPVLDESEFKALLDRRSRMPKYMTVEALLKGDIDSVLQDQMWNPEARALTLDERAELGVLLRDYQFFAHRSRQDRLRDQILPLVETMREQGAYVEHPSDQPPPRFQGASLVHAEPSDDPQVKRLYVFYPDDHPDMYHAHTVEYQRESETFVKIFELINDS